MKSLIVLFLLAFGTSSLAADLKFEGARLVCFTRTADLQTPIIDVSVLADGNSVIVRNAQQPTHEPATFNGKLDAVEFNGKTDKTNIKLKLVRLTGLIEIEKPKNPAKWTGRCQQGPVF